MIPGSPFVFPLAGGFDPVYDLRVRDVDGDGLCEILVSTERLSDGIIQIYRLTGPGSLELFWTNEDPPDGMSFQTLEVADLDGNGTNEIVAGSRLEHSGGAGYFVHVFDLATRQEVRRSAAPATGFGAFTRVEVVDSDGDGSLEILGLAGNRGLRIHDGTTLAQEAAGSYAVVEFRRSSR
jgi:hypothetical protein